MSVLWFVRWKLHEAKKIEVLNEKLKILRIHSLFPAEYFAY